MATPAAVVWFRQDLRVADHPGDAFDTLTNYVIFGGYTFYNLAVAAVFVLRRKLPFQPRPYRTWGYPFTPALYVVAFAWLAFRPATVNRYAAALVGFVRGARAGHVADATPLSAPSLTRTLATAATWLASTSGSTWTRAIGKKMGGKSSPAPVRPARPRG